MTALIKLLIAAGLLVLPQNGNFFGANQTPSNGTTFALYSHCKSDLGSGSVSSINCTVTVPATGALITVPAAFINSTTPGTVTISDGFSSTFHAVDNGLISTGTMYNYWASASGSGSDTVTLSWTGGALGFNLLSVGAYNKSTSGIDDHKTGSGTGATASAANMTTTAANDIAVSGVLTDMGATVSSAGCSLTSEDSFSNVTGGWGDKLVASAASGITTCFNLTGTPDWLILSMAFKP